MKHQEVQHLLDQTLPVPEGEFPPLKIIELRHILAAYLIAGSYQKASKLLDISPKTIQTRLRGIKVRCRRAATMIDEIRPIEPEQPEDESIDYPSHRDFKFFDWYYNQDSIRGLGISRPNKKHDYKHTTDQEDAHA